MTRDYNQLDLLASIIQRFVLTLAVLVGGGWAIFVFVSTLELQRSRATLAKLQLDSQAYANLRISIDASSERIPQMSGHFIRGTVTISNVGTRNTVLAIGDTCIRVAEVQVIADTGITFGEEYLHGIYMAPSWEPREKSILVGGTETLPFLVRVPSDGTWLVSFSAPRDSTDRALAEQLGRGNRGFTPPKSNRPWSWTGAKYVFVQ